MHTRLLMSAAVLALPIAGAFATPMNSQVSNAHFVPIKEIIVPIVDAEKVNGLLHVDLVLETADEATAAKLAARLPVLRAASVAATLEFSSLYASGLAPVDAERLRIDLEQVLRRGNPEIAHVLVVGVAASVG